MTKIQTIETTIKIEKTKAYSKFTLANEPWMPEVRKGDALLALQKNIKKHGLLRPIIADKNGVIYQGRSRYLACKAAGVELRIQRMETKEAKQHAVSHRVQRFDSVLDRVRFVKWVRQEILNQKRKGSLKENISQELRKIWGWTHGGSMGQVQKYLEIIVLMEKSKNKEAVEDVVRKASHLHEAQCKLCRNEGSMATTKSQSGPGKKLASKPDLLGKLKRELKKIGTDPKKAHKEQLVSFVRKVRTLVELN
jgi:hypothetical protein